MAVKVVTSTELAKSSLVFCRLGPCLAGLSLVQSSQDVTARAAHSLATSHHAQTITATVINISAAWSDLALQSDSSLREYAFCFQRLKPRVR